jgi:hypothetical protein
MENLNLKALELSTFISGGDRYEETIRFYQEISFELDWRSDDIAIFRKGTLKFFLQKYPNAWMHDNFMMALEVENLDDWWTMLSSLGLEKKYSGVRLKAPQNYPWGKREIHLIDPVGVLWHISVSAN